MSDGNEADRRVSVTHDDSNLWRGTHWSLLCEL